MDATGKINDLIEITERLGNLLVKENKALSEKNAKEATRYLEEKSNLSRIYENRIKGMMDNPAALAAVAPELRQKLRERGEKINAMIVENASLLKIAISTNKQLVDLIADAVKSQRPGPGIYSAKGTSNKTDVHSAPRNMALSLDQSL
jgi:hypothetical protein